MKDGYFQPGYSAVDYSNGEPNALMYTNKAAMQLQLNFLYSQMQTQDAVLHQPGPSGLVRVPVGTRRHR